ncbi:MAG: hypothetical protein IJN64_16505 [Lachnospiraceae bacterium]|nr:hypothetical protein [Lachnospiraceae bacterium]
MQNEQVTSKLPSKMSVIVRIMVSAYLLYTVLSLGDVWNRYSNGELILYLVIMIFFVVIALFMGSISIRDLIKGKYCGGAMDRSEASEENRE